MNITVAELKSLAADRIVELCAELAPGGKASGAYWLAKSPLRADKHAGSFGVWIKGPAAGAWKDWGAGLQGDLIDLVAATKWGVVDRSSRGEAIKWLRQFLGLGGASPAEFKQRRDQARRGMAERERRAARQQAQKAAGAVDLWRGGAPLGGTLAETYLAARGILPRTIPHLSATFRFSPLVDYWREDQRWRGPAILGRYRDARGVTRAVHGTWLRADGAGKADLSPAKLSFGAYKDCFLCISKGAAGREIWEDGCVPGPCMVTEGPEDGWTMAQAEPSIRSWAAGALSNIGNMPPHPMVSLYLIVRQNDWDKPAAVAAFETAVERVRAHTPVEIVASGYGKDPNDQLRGVT